MGLWDLLGLHKLQLRGKGLLWLWRFCPLLPVPFIVPELPYPLLLCTNKATEVFAWDVLG